MVGQFDNVAVYLFMNQLAFNVYRFANTSWKQWKRSSMVGFGLVQMVEKSAITDMLFLLAIF